MHSLDTQQRKEVALASVARLPAMHACDIDAVRAVEAVMLQLENPVDFPTQHLIHAGMYARTLVMPAQTVLTGALLKVATTLIVSGDCEVFIGDGSIPLRGYNVLPGSAGRKQVFYAHTEVHMTMLFPTSETDVLACEKQFTDEWPLLMTNRMEVGVDTLITGE